MIDRNVGNILPIFATLINIIGQIELPILASTQFNKVYWSGKSSLSSHLKSGHKEDVEDQEGDVKRGQGLGQREDIQDTQSVIMALRIERKNDKNYNVKEEQGQLLCNVELKTFIVLVLG
jgi:hypothetical protein